MNPHTDISTRAHVERALSRMATAPKWLTRLFAAVLAGLLSAIVTHDFPLGFLVFAIVIGVGYIDARGRSTKP